MFWAICQSGDGEVLMNDDEKIRALADPFIRVQSEVEDEWDLVEALARRVLELEELVYTRKKDDSGY